jgi:hypothetical protein
VAERGGTEPRAVIGPGKVFIGPAGQDGGWTYIGRTEGGVSTRVLPGVDVEWPPSARLTASVTVGMPDFWTSDRWRWLHDFDRKCYPRKHRRCHVCHPKWSRPLAVNGREYRRRQRARQRRQRHGR